MYDTIRFHDETAPRCAAGHPLPELQTKDLDCALNVYRVFAGRLYRPDTQRGTSSRIDDQGRLVVTETRAAEPASISADLTAYASCGECRPVLFLRAGALRHDYVAERRPWCEWRIVVRDGRLEGRDAVRVESRDDVANALRREGVEVLADDERLARLHFERSGKQRWSDW
jgi:hypothetical protein